MKLDQSLVQYIAHLSRIELSEAEIEYFLPQMEHILAYIEKMNALDLKNIPPVVSFSENVNVFRQDIPLEFAAQECILQDFPNRKDRSIEIPNVIE